MDNIITQAKQSWSIAKRKRKISCSICEEDVKDQPSNHIDITQVKGSRYYTKEDHAFQKWNSKVGMA
jgi:hypothetical protein